VQKLIDHLDRDLKYAIEVEGKLELEAVTNYDEIKEEIKCKVGPYVSVCIGFK
jgi:DNA polymerase epsilon subunit 1